ncbi:MAG: DUF4363 family protein [Oscillospiraceae bacterium]|jgi:hypothetical protein|nr:DUF4363 family protein [Oscillospiraceae bacterium]
MKKELVAAILLAALFVGALFNVKALDALSGDIELLIDEAERSAGIEAWDAAERAAEDAVSLWESRSGYTHIVLRHSITEDVSDKLSELVKSVYSHEPGPSAGAAKAARSRMESMSEIEHISMGSIF